MEYFSGRNREIPSVCHVAITGHGQNRACALVQDRADAEQSMCRIEHAQKRSWAGWGMHVVDAEK